MPDDDGLERRGTSQAYVPSEQININFPNFCDMTKSGQIQAPISGVRFHPRLTISDRAQLNHEVDGFSAIRRFCCNV
ncbi:hypothetical protein OUZ56_032058 [Daphnia magna]|uniref:Uncharacterized protein n=1 Tax=Daphnia magna TaxID=35525 RepID=A0ABQ9ZW10_9CRUS|nr:hypothetical protein OUZ56_032058 [Daphnia magna]